MAKRSNIDRINDSFASKWNTSESFTFLPLATLRKSEVEDCFSSSSGNAKSGDVLFNTRESVTFAIVDTEGGVTQKEVETPEDQMKETWNKHILNAVREEFRKLYGKNFYLRKYVSMINDCSYEIWTNSMAAEVNPYMGKILPNEPQVRGSLIIFRLRDAKKSKVTPELYRSVSQTQLTKLFNVSTSERDRQIEIKHLMNQSQSVNGDNPPYIHDQKNSPRRWQPFSLGRSTQKLQEKLFPQKRRREQIREQSGHMESNNTYSESNDNYACHTSEEDRRIEGKRKLVYITEKEDDADYYEPRAKDNPSVFTRDTDFSPKPDIVFDDPLSRKKKKKVDKIEKTQPSVRKSNRIRRKSIKRR